jgi:hypothetical protein
MLKKSNEHALAVRLSNTTTSFLQPLRFFRPRFAKTFSRGGDKQKHPSKTVVAATFWRASRKRAEASDINHAGGKKQKRRRDANNDSKSALEMIGASDIDTSDPGLSSSTNFKMQEQECP